MNAHPVDKWHESWCRNCTVLRQCALSREQRWIPSPQTSPVWDEVYTQLIESGQLRWVRVTPGCQSLGDYLEVNHTAPGVE